MARCQRHSTSAAQRWERWTCSGSSPRRLGIAHLLGVDADASITIAASTVGGGRYLPAVGTQCDGDVAGQAEMVSCDDAISSGLVL
jgi:hypothetical protein